MARTETAVMISLKKAPEVMLWGFLVYLLRLQYMHIAIFNSTKQKQIITEMTMIKKWKEKQHEGICIEYA